MNLLRKSILGLVMAAVFAGLFTVYGYGQANIALGSYVSGGQVTPAAPSGGDATFNSVGLADGTAPLPSLYFTADRNTGVFRPATDTFGIAAGGVDSAWFTATGWQGLNSLTDGIQLYNTVYDAVNYERLEMLWSGNQAFIRTAKGGTGTLRPIFLLTGSGPTTYLGVRPTGDAASGMFQFQGTTTAVAGNIGYFFSGVINTATSGSNVGLSLNPTYNQASGNAANTDLLINRTQTAVGSGNQRLIDAQVSTVSQFSVVNNGHVLLGGLTTDGTGVLQFATGTTNAGGITFGTDAAFYRTAQGAFSFDAVSGSSNAGITINARSTGTAVNGFIQVLSGGNMQVGTASTTAFTVDGSQGVTFVAKAVSTSPSAGVGYATGAGGTVTQATNKATGVTLNTVTGQITLNAASLAAGTSVSFTVTDSVVAAKDVIIPNIASGATAASYTITIDAVAAGSFRVHLRNESAGALAEAIVINYAVIKGA